MRRLALLSVLLAAAPAFAAPKTIIVELGKEFKLRKQQTAKLKSTDAAVTITGFINSPCPKGARCVWSGQSVQFELSVAGSTIPLAGAPYAVDVVRSDYVAWAVLLVRKIK